MAVPVTLTTANMSGKFVQNKSLSDDTDKMLQLQGVSFLTRKAVGVATFNATLNHTTTDGVEKLVASQSLTGGLGASDEARVFDGQQYDMTSKLWGKTKEVCTIVALDQIEQDDLKSGWADACKEHGVFHIHTEGTDTKWVTNAIWGLEEVDGLLRHVRRISFTGPGGEKIYARMVFDYVGDA